MVDSNEYSKMDEKLKKAVSRAFKKTVDSLKREPYPILISDNTGDGIECPINEVTSWLFRRRQDNDVERN